MKFTNLTTTLFFLLIVASPLFAQDSAVLEEEKQPIISAGLSVGALFSNVNSNRLAFPVTQLDFNKFDKHTNINEYISIHFLYHINAEYGIESGVIYDKKTYQFSGRTDVTVGGVTFDNREVDATYKYEYFTIPVLFKKTLGQNNLKASIYAGPYFSFLQSATFTIQDHTIVEEHGGGFKEVTNEQALTINELARNTNIGILIKAGVELEASSIITPFANLFYAKSFSRIDNLRESYPDYQNSDGQHASYGISVGAYFKMK